MRGRYLDQESLPWLAHYPAGVDWAASLETGPVYDVLAHTARQFPRHRALFFLGRSVTYRQLSEMVDRAAGGLQKIGVKKGDRVGLMMPNCPFFVAYYYAVLKIGAVVVNINPLYAEREIRHVIADSGLRLLVTVDLALVLDKLRPILATSDDLRLVVCPFVAGLPWLKGRLFRWFRRRDLAAWPRDGRHIHGHHLIRDDHKPQQIALDPHQDMAVLQYTGGTTGTPKAAMLTHANLTANMAQSRLWLAGTSPHGLRLGQERMLAVLPLFHSFAMTVGLNLGIAIGAELVLMPRYDLGMMRRLIARRRVTIFPGVPSIFNALSMLPKPDLVDLASLSICIAGGAPLPHEVKSRFEAATGIMLVEGYGLTEASPVVAVNPLTGGKAGSIGQPLPGTIIEIRDPEPPYDLKPQGEAGEICIRGPQLMQGYWHQPEQTAQTLRDGRLHTGDIGYLDEQGFCFVIDRLKDLVLVNGYNVYPRHVEEAIYLHPDVEEVIVGGLPDALRGEMVKAWVKRKPDSNLDAETLKSFLKDKISPIEIPRQIEFRDVPLPKTLIGKLSRKAVIEEELSRQKQPRS